MGRAGLPIVTGTGLLLVVLLFGGCGEENPTPVASPELMEMGADQVMTRMETIITTSGVREGRVQADTAFLFNDSTTAILRNPTLVLFNEGGVTRATVTALHGRLDTTTKELQAWGEVVLLIHDGNRRVETSELNYDPDRDRIWSDSATVMREGGRTIRGRSFESDLQFRNARVLNGSITGGGVRF
ncbi:LPS export ABC transporter periplasmic protein LptC [Gemmatimonadota bacterium]